MIEVLNKTTKGRLFTWHLFMCEECRNEYIELDKAIQIPVHRIFRTVERIIENNHPGRTIL